MLPVLPMVINREDACCYTTKKFLEGMQQYVSLWPGKVKALMYPTQRHTSNLDEVKVSYDKLNFELKAMDYRSLEFTEALRRAAVVLASLGHRMHSIARLCNSLHVPVVFTTENSLTTRLQVVRTTENNLFKRVRKYFWEAMEEFRNRSTVRRAAGVQCNGVPTYNVYSKINPQTLLFFDTRVRDAMIVKPHQVKDKYRPETIRLVFSGRLTAIKGVMDLIDVAKLMVDRGVNFKLTICGDGELAGPMKKQIQSNGLESRVNMPGNLDFTGELVPFVSQHCDAFVCCHTQGDPSCTYLETMSCGVPIVGYNNEAFGGISALSGAGWITPMKRPEALAAMIASLAVNREEILAHSLKSLKFAAQHSFEKTFTRRIEHLLSVIK